MSIVEGPLILIVDDDRDFAESVRAFLEANGFRVRWAPNAREGLHAAHLERPDLVLMDVIMDERTEGFFAVQQFRRTPALASIPIFILTSIYEAVEDFRVEPDPGWLAHDAFFPKPVDTSKLLAAIRERLAPRGGPGDFPEGVVRP